MKDRTTGWMAIIFGLIAIALGVYCLRLINERKFQQSISENFDKELQIWRDDSGRQVAKIEFLEFNSLKTLREFETTNTELIELKKIVEQYRKKLKKGGSVTLVKGKTVIETVIKEVQGSRDSIYPVYTGDVNLGKWIYGNVVANKDSITLGLTVVNEYDVIFGRDKTGFLGLGKSKPFVQVTNYNPYSEINTIKTFNVERNKPRRFGLGVTAGYGITLDNLSPVPFVGAGLNYTFIRF
jgi:hypothetical protein